jgi:hypothetical protein
MIMARMLFLIVTICIVGCVHRPKAITEIIVTRQPGTEDVKAEFHFRVESAP